MENLGEDNIEVTEKLIERAQSGKHSSFTFLRSLEELRAFKKYIDATVAVWEQFNEMAYELYETYIEKRKNGIDEISWLLTSRNCADVATFYAEELDILQDIQDEYKSYVLKGHIFDTIFGKVRTIDDLIDYRNYNPLKFTEESDE